MKRRKALDLGSNLGRRVHEKPTLAVRADRYGFLTSRHGGEPALTEPAAVRTTTVPLREPAPGRRAQYPDQHEPPGTGPALPAAMREGPGQTMTQLVLRSGRPYPGRYRRAGERCSPRPSSLRWMPASTSCLLVP